MNKKNPSSRPTNTRPERQAQARPAQARPAERGDGRPRRSLAAFRIEQVQRVLGEVLQWASPADAVLSHWLRANPALGGRDRAELAEGVYDVVRNLRRYRQLAESGVGNANRRLAILGLAATRGLEWLKDALDPGEADWLARVDHVDPASLPRAVRFSLPDWLEERLGSLPGPDALMEALQQPAQLDVRSNPLKIERDALLAKLREGPAGRYDPQPMPYSPWASASRATRPSIAGRNSRAAWSRCRTRAASCWPCWWARAVAK